MRLEEQILRKEKFMFKIHCSDMAVAEKAIFSYFESTGMDFSAYEEARDCILRLDIPYCSFSIGQEKSNDFKVTMVFGIEINNTNDYKTMVNFMAMSKDPNIEVFNVYGDVVLSRIFREIPTWFRLDYKMPKPSNFMNTIGYILGAK